MWKKGIAIVAVAGLFSGSAYAGCVPVKGKIVNNIFPAEAGFFTMGVAAVSLGGDVKLKCALLGQPVPPPNPQDPTSVAFVHTISCDDAIATLQGPIHSKLQFNTVGTVNPATGSFTETPQGAYPRHRHRTIPKCEQPGIAHHSVVPMLPTVIRIGLDRMTILTTEVSKEPVSEVAHAQKGWARSQGVIAGSASPIARPGFLARGRAIFFPA